MESEQIEQLATKVSELMFSEAVKEPGKALGKALVDNVSGLVARVKAKFQEVGADKSLTRAQEKPTPANIKVVEAQLVSLMEEEPQFADALREQLTGIQTMLADLKVKGNVKAGDLLQEMSQPGIQKMASNIETDGDITLGNLTQKQ